MHGKHPKRSRRSLYELKTYKFLRLDLAVDAWRSNKDSSTCYHNGANLVSTMIRNNIAISFLLISHSYQIWL